MCEICSSIKEELKSVETILAIEIISIDIKECNESLTYWQDKDQVYADSIIPVRVGTKFYSKVDDILRVESIEVYRIEQVNHLLDILKERQTCLQKLSVQKQLILN